MWLRMNVGPFNTAILAILIYLLLGRFIPSHMNGPLFSALADEAQAYW